MVELLEQAGERLDQIMIPKVGCAADVYAVDALVTAVETAKGREKKISFEVIIESAAGIAHVEEIAASSPRLQAMSLGAADFAASMGMQTTGIGGTQENYYMQRGEQKHWSDPWHWAQAAIVAACRTHGVLPVDGPFGDFSDDEGFRAQARRSATLGMVGKWAIHPKQVALSNEVFTPSDEAVAEAREILAAMEEAKAKGEGATVYKGRLVDIASAGPAARWRWRRARGRFSRIKSAHARVAARKPSCPHAPGCGLDGREFAALETHQVTPTLTLTLTTDPDPTSTPDPNPHPRPQP